MKKKNLILSLALLVAGAVSAQIGQYKFRSINGTYTSISTVGTSVLPVAYQNQVSTVPLGFTFNFDGRNYTDVHVTSDGFIGFGGNTPTATVTAPLSTDAYDGVISAFGSNLDGPENETAYYHTSGVSPNRVFTVEWKDVRWRTSPVTVGNRHNFQIKLFEGSNKIQIIYGDQVAQNLADGQVGIRGAFGQFSNLRDNGDFNNPFYGYSPVHRLEIFDATSVPTKGLTFEYTFCSTCSVKYWAGAGSQLDSPSTSTDLNLASNWSSTGPTGPITATSAPGLNDSIVIRANGVLEMSNDLHVSALTMYGTFVDVSGELHTKTSTLTVDNGVYLDIVNDLLGQPSSVHNSIVLGDPASAGGNMIINGRVYLGKYSTSGGAFSDISTVANSDAKLNVKGAVMDLEEFSALGFNGNLNLEFSHQGITSFSNSMSGTTPQSSMNLKNLTVGNGTDITVVEMSGVSGAVINEAAPNAGDASLIVKSNSTLNLNKGLTLNRAATITGPGGFLLEANAKLRVEGATGGQAGSNFPSNFSAYDLMPGSTVEYYSDDEQEIAPLVYGNIESSSTGDRVIAGTVELKNDFISGTNTYTTTGSTLVFSGTDMQQITGGLGSSTNVIDALELNNSAAAVTKGLQLNADLNVNELTLTDGLIQLNGKKMNLLATGAGALTFVDGAFANTANDFSGQLVWTVNDVTGLRTVPFVDATGGNDAKIYVDLTTGDAEKLIFSSYYTGTDNTPLPTGATSLPNQGGSDAADNTVDRFFMVDQTSTNTLESELSFRFATGEKPTTNTQLEGQRFSGSAWEAPIASQAFTAADDSLHIPAVVDLGVFAIIDQAPIPIAAGFTATPTSLCAGSTVQYTSAATGPVTSHSWTFPGGTPATSSDVNPIVTYSTSGSYDATLVVGNGTTTESHTESAFITVHELPTATVSGGGTTCDGNATFDVALTGVGPWDITITDGTTPVSITGIQTSPYQHAVSADGTYTVSDVLDANCTGSATGSATVTTVSSVQITNVQENCNGNEYVVSFDITGGEAASYNVSGSTTGTLTGSTFVSDVIPSGQAYSFTADDANSCDPQTISNTVSCACPADATIAGIDSICSGETGTVTVTFTGTAPFSFEYSDGTNNFVITDINQNTYDIFANTSATYTLVDMNDDVCTGTVSGTGEIRQFDFPSVSIEDEDICEGDVLTVTPVIDLTGGEYLWSTGESTPTIDVSPLSTESFDLVYTKDGCASTEMFDVNVTATPQTPTISIVGLTITSDVANGNQWYKDGVMIPGATANQYMVSQNGVYTSIVTNGDCESDVSNEIEVTNVGIEEASFFQDMKLYPNPTSGLFTLEMSEQAVNELDEVSIINVLGQTVRTLDVTQTQKVDISDLNPGVYFVKVQSDNEAASLRLIRR